ncbi:MAG: T9SS type A sorting domain-containing protein, partial [Bacteroidales bacterium]|nr:T9SS type A sorting domain-containing protein [Bacteroidales bacterium]
IPTVEQSRELKVYPNPTYGSVTVQHESTLIERVTVTDLYGRTVAIIPINDYQGNLNLSGLPAGVYLLNIEFENKDIVTTKLLRY